MPATYLVCIVILGITVVPLLYVFLDGARSTAQNYGAKPLSEPLRG